MPPLTRARDLPELAAFFEPPAKCDGDTSDYRSASLSATLDRLWRTRETYGVARVGDLTTLDSIGLPVFTAVRPNAMDGNLTVSSGKGLDREAALVSALAEACESHATEGMRHQLARFSLDEAGRAGMPHVSPHELGIRPGVALGARTVLEWQRFRELRTGDAAWIPADYTLVPYRPTTHEPIAHGASDGMAAGNTVCEAVLHALYELIERDGCAFGVWLSHGARIEPASLPDHLARLIDRMAFLGIEARMYRFPGVAGIMVYYTVLVDHRRQDAMFLCAGAGAHHDGDVGAFRSVSEAVQTRACVLSGGREDLALKYRANRSLGFTAALDRIDAWDATMPREPFGRASAAQSGADLAQVLGGVLGRLATDGFDRVYARVLSDRSLPLSVVKVVVPGLEVVEDRRSPIGPRFRQALGRWHDDHSGGRNG